MPTFGRALRWLALIALSIVAVLILALLALVGMGQLFTHLHAAIAVLLVVGFFAALAKWKTATFRLERPWLRSGASEVDRRYQERWEQAHVRERLRGARREEGWRE